MSPAVYRNPRYEHRLAMLERQVVELARMAASQAEALGTLYRAFLHSQDVEAHLPPLPETVRGFGMGH